jgi:hypothetical protein
MQKRTHSKATFSLGRAEKLEKSIKLGKLVKKID